MRITRLAVGPSDNNVYLLADGDDLVIVDAANDAPAILEAVDGRRVSTIVTTHRHPDHIAALPAVARATRARLVTGRPDADAIASATGLTLESLWDGDTVTVGATTLGVIGLVGHTPGAIALAHTPADGPAVLIVGDSLFPGGVGMTRSPEDFASLLGDVTTKLFGRFADDTVVLPGHGASTTLGAERPHLAEWRARGW